MINWDSKVHYSAGSLSCRQSQGLVIWPRLKWQQVFWPRLNDLFVSQNPRQFCSSHPQGRILVFAYTICSYDQLQFLAQFPGDHLADQVVSSVYTLFVLICLYFTILLRLIYSCFEIVGPYGVVYGAIRRDSVSLCRFPFLCHVQLFSYEISFFFVAWRVHWDVFLPTFIFCLFLFSWWLCCFIIIITPWELFTPALADSLSMKFKWQQVSSSLHDSSQYSGRSQ